MKKKPPITLVDGSEARPVQKEEAPPIDYKVMSWDEKKTIARQLYVSSKNSVPEISDELGVHERTIYGWAKKEDWNKQRIAIAELSQKLYKSLEWVNDPKTLEKDIAEGNLKLLLEIQAIHLANIKYTMLTGDASPATVLPAGLADAVQKYAATIEKLTNTRIKMDTGGVAESKVTHVHQIDMDQALQLAIKVKRETGQAMSVTDAAKVLEAQIAAKGAK